MHDVVPIAVSAAVKMDITICINVFQVSRFIAFISLISHFLNFSFSQFLIFSISHFLIFSIPQFKELPSRANSLVLVRLIVAVSASGITAA